MAPELATQARDFLADSVTVLGKSPKVETGAPIGVRVVAEPAEIPKRETVLEPAFTAMRNCCKVSWERVRSWSGRIYVAIGFNGALAE